MRIELLTHTLVIETVGNKVMLPSLKICRLSFKRLFSGGGCSDFQRVRSFLSLPPIQPLFQEMAYWYCRRRRFECGLESPVCTEFILEIARGVREERIVLNDEEDVFLVSI